MPKGNYVNRYYDNFVKHSDIKYLTPDKIPAFNIRENEPVPVWWIFWTKHIHYATLMN